MGPITLQRCWRARCCPMVELHNKNTAPEVVDAAGPIPGRCVHGAGRSIPCRSYPCLSLNSTRQSILPPCLVPKMPCFARSPGGCFPSCASCGCWPGWTGSISASPSCRCSTRSSSARRSTGWAPASSSSAISSSKSHPMPCCRRSARRKPSCASPSAGGSFASSSHSSPHQPSSTSCASCWARSRPASIPGLSSISPTGTPVPAAPRPSAPSCRRRPSPACLAGHWPAAS
ncbi:hypothetical protein D3C78_543380 [compost metagenome]